MPVKIAQRGGETVGTLRIGQRVTARLDEVIEDIGEGRHANPEDIG